MPLIYYPQLLRSTAEDIYLLYINIKNAFYNFFLFILEAAAFYPDKLLRRVDIELFKTYALRDQFTVSQEESQQLFSDLDPEEFIYGEATWRSLAQVLDFIRPRPGDVFFDLGCGTGRICFLANIYYELETHGIDLIPSFIANACTIADKFNLKNIHFYRENWLHHDLSKADIIYIAATCLDDATLNELSEKLKALKAGSFIISVSNPLKGPHLQLLKTMNLPFSWGKAEVFISRVL